MLAKIDFDQIDVVSDKLKILCNPDRLRILCVLNENHLNVQEIEELTQISQPTLSQQLTVLRKAKIVDTERQGKFIYYSFKDAKSLKIIDTLHKLYCE
jgi:DNA-binding transcriptional ArsR family regulator